MKNPKVAFSVLFKKSNSSSSLKAFVPDLVHLRAKFSSSISSLIIFSDGYSSEIDL
jgi:hypothetical protein